MKKYLLLLGLSVLISACNMDQTKSTITQFAVKIQSFASSIVKYPYKDTFVYIKNNFASKSNNLYKENYNFKIETQPEDIELILENLSSLCKETPNCDIVKEKLNLPHHGISPFAHLVIRMNIIDENLFIDEINSTENAKISFNYKQKNIQELIDFHTAKQDVLQNLQNDLIDIQETSQTPNENFNKSISKISKEVSSNQIILDNLDKSNTQTLIKIDIQRVYLSNLSYFKNAFYSFMYAFYSYGLIPIVLIGAILPWFLLVYAVKLLIALFRKDEK